MHTRTASTDIRRQRGLSIIEVLVGLTIGLVLSIAIFQTLISWNVRTRTTASGGDAQVSGTLSMYRLDRDLKHAGMGFGMAPAQDAGCTVTTSDNSFSFPLVAVFINPGATAADPDELRILYGESDFNTSGVAIAGSTVDTKAFANSRSGFHPGDFFVATNRLATPANCRLLEMTGVPMVGDTARTIEHKAGTSYNYYYERNAATPGARTSSANNTTGTAWGTFTSGSAYNLGPDPQLAWWTVSPKGSANPFLRRSSQLVFNPATRLRTPTADEEIATGVVNLKAQYGVDADGDSIVSDTEWTTTAPTDWTRLRAVRLALLVRGEFYEPPVTTGGVTSCLYSTGGQPVPRWFGTAFEMTNIGGAGGSPLDATDWRCYRYTVYERVVPLRNMIWGNNAPTAG